MNVQEAVLPQARRVRVAPSLSAEGRRRLIEVPEDLGLHNALLREHEAVYNGLRPHQALGYLTPNEFLARCQADHR